MGMCGVFFSDTLSAFLRVVKNSQMYERASVRKNDDFTSWKAGLVKVLY